VARRAWVIALSLALLTPTADTPAAPAAPAGAAARGVRACGAG
jgi:hypothetical protein